MAKIRKKKRITSNASLKSGILDISAPTITRRPSIPLIVLNGLSTRKDLRAAILVEFPLNKYGIKPEITITKSNIFHALFKYAFLPQTNPKADIFNNISNVYIA